MTIKCLKQYLPAALLCLIPPTAALAEPGNYDAMGRAIMLALLCLAAYAVLAVLLLVFAIKRDKRRFLRTFVIGAAIAIGVPLADTALLSYQKARVAAAQIQKDVSRDLGRAEVLFVSERDNCNRTLCAGLMELRNGDALYALAPGAVSRLDFAQPIDLATAPLVRITPLPDSVRSYEATPLGFDDPRPSFDYVVLDRGPFYLTRASALEQAFPLMPKGTFLGSKLSIDTLTGPLTDNTLNLATLQPDHLSLYNARDALAVPLFVENTIYGSDRGWRWRQQRAEWVCASGQDGTRAKSNCINALK